MSRAIVYNDNKYDYKERFKGEIIKIPAGGSIEMDFFDAMLFKSQMPPNIELDGNGIQKPESYKMLRVVKKGHEPIVKVSQFACHSCSEEFMTEAAYKNHVKAKHLADMVDEEAVEELLEEKPAAAKRGRPKKGS